MGILNVKRGIWVQYGDETASLEVLGEITAISRILGWLLLAWCSNPLWARVFEIFAVTTLLLYFSFYFERTANSDAEVAMHNAGARVGWSQAAEPSPELKWEAQALAQCCIKHRSVHWLHKCCRPLPSLSSLASGMATSALGVMMVISSRISQGVTGTRGERESQTATPYNGFRH